MWSGAERSGERAWERNDGAEREVAERERRGTELAAHSPLQRNISLISKVYHNVVLHSPHSTVYTSTVNSLNIT